MTDTVKSFLFAESVPERSTPMYRVTMRTQSGGVFPAANITSVRLWIRDIETDAIVNSRDGVDVMNANGGTLSDGLFTMQFSQEDMAILGSGSAERRLMTLDFQMSGSGRISREVRFYVRNFRDIA